MAITSDQLKAEVGEKGYTILLNNVPWMVQDSYFPYPGATMAESAQNHINQILADQKAVEENAKKPTLEDRVKSLEALALGDMGV